MERETISAENLTAVGKSFDLKNQKTTQKLGNMFGLFKDTSFVVIIMNREFNLRAERRIIPYSQFFYIIERNSSEKKYTMREEDWRKAKTSEAETNSIMMKLQGRTELCTLLQICARIRSDEKILPKFLT